MATNLSVGTANFESEVLQSNVPVLVDFWATWCRPCQVIGPHIEQLATEFEGKAKVYKVDVDQDGALAERYGILSIPALLVFKNGQEVDRMGGAASKDHIKAFLERNL